MSDTDQEIPSVFTFDEDVSQTEAPPPLPVGQYIGEVVGCEPKLSSKGSPMCVVQFRIGADQYPADYKDGNPDGTTLTHYIVVQDNQQSRFRLKTFVEALGLTVRKEFDPNTLMGAGS